MLEKLFQVAAMLLAYGGFAVFVLALQRDSAATGGARMTQELGGLTAVCGALVAMIWGSAVVLSSA